MILRPHSEGVALGYYGHRLSGGTKSNYKGVILPILSSPVNFLVVANYGFFNGVVKWSLLFEKAG